MSGTPHIVIDVKNLDEVKTEINALRAELARRDEIIRRLKEDGERLVKHFVVVDPDDGINECIQCNGSDYLQENNVLVHMPDCPITLHRALMKELNQTGELK